MPSKKTIYCIITLTAGLLIFPSLSRSADAGSPSTCSGDKASKSLDKPQIANSSTVAESLNWVPSLDPNNICGGYYLESPDLVENPNPGPPKQLPVQISSSGPTVFVAKGWSILQQNVVVTQLGRIITADVAYLYHDPKLNKITQIVFVGHVHLQEYGKLIITNYMALDLLNHTVLFHHVIYHISESTVQSLQHNMKLKYDAWGVASHAYRDQNQVLQLWNANYTTCSPLNPAWQIQAGHLNLNKITGMGTAHDVLLRFKKVPVMYLPYMTFPIDDRRRTGFLWPTFGFSSTNGMELSTPFYWNIAPNYDLTLTPREMTYRGLQMNGLFRYLTPDNSGQIYASVLPEDGEFQKFKTQTLASYPWSLPNPQPYLTALENGGDTRAFFSINDTSVFSPEWSSHLKLNYVTDPYYFVDFGNTYNSSLQNQLLNQWDVDYSGIHWNIVGLLQAYQSLHLVTQIDNPITDQYIRLPEFDFNANYPDLIGRTDFQLDGQAVNFLFEGDLPPPTWPDNQLVPVGQRVHLRPSLSRSFDWSAGYFTPQISLDNTDYSDQQGNSPGAERTNFTASRNLPILDLDNGWYFDRHFGFDDQDYTQTLEPRVFYLYVPYQNQDAYPNFDTQLLPFSTNQLYALNRFTGYDRLENANQISLGMTSRIFESDNAIQKIKASLGVIYYFQRPQVSLPDISLPNTNFSPIAGDLTFYPWTHWSTSFDGAWDINQHELDNGEVSINYNRDSQYVATLGYTFVRDIDGIPDNSLGLSNDTNLIQLGLAWPISQRWSGLAYWYYDIAHQRPQSYFAGLEYSSCCWAIRFVASRSFLGVAPTSTGTQVINQFKNTYYVQIMLKGLGDFGNNDPGSLLTSALPGYKDPFSQ